jgi:hypothetical protein
MKQRKASSGVHTIGSPLMRAGLGDSDAGDRLFLSSAAAPFQLRKQLHALFGQLGMW